MDMLIASWCGMALLWLPAAIVIYQLIKGEE